VAVSVISAVSVVDNSTSSIGIVFTRVALSTGVFKFLNLIMSPFCNLLLGALTVKILEALGTEKGLFGKKSSVANSVLAGHALIKACGSAFVGLGSSCGCFGSYSDMCTKAPFHSLTISLYGKAIPDRSDIAKANLPCAKLLIRLLGNKF